MTVHRRAIVVSAALLTATALPGSVRVASAAAEAPSGAWVLFTQVPDPQMRSQAMGL